MSRIDRAFAHSECLIQFNSLRLIRLHRGLSDHFPIVLGEGLMSWGWKPFKGLDCWFSDPRFISILNDFWIEVSDMFPGRYKVIKKINNFKEKMKVWNKESYGNQIKTLS